MEEFLGTSQNLTKNLKEDINKSITNTLLQSSKNCSQNNSSNQFINMSNIKIQEGCKPNFSRISQTSTSVPNFTCAQNVSNKEDLEREVNKKLKENIEQTMKGSPGFLDTTVNKTESVNRLVQEVTKELNISNVGKCVQDNIANQYIKMDGYEASCAKHCWDDDSYKLRCKNKGDCNQEDCIVNISDISQTLTQNAVANCMLKENSVIKVVDKYASDIDSKIKNATEGINLTTIIIVVSIVVFAIIVGALIFIAWRYGWLKKSKKSTE